MMRKDGQLSTSPAMAQDANLSTSRIHRHRPIPSKPGGSRLREHNAQHFNHRWNRSLCPTPFSEILLATTPASTCSAGLHARHAARMQYLNFTNCRADPLHNQSPEAPASGNTTPRHDNHPVVSPSAPTLSTLTLA